MARAWTDEAEKTSLGRMRWAFADVPRRVEALSNGALKPAGPEDFAALAVMREEQAPRRDSMTGRCPTCGAPVDDDGECVECGPVAAPPPPCATCEGETWVGEPGQRVNCPDCARGGR